MDRLLWATKYCAEMATAEGGTRDPKDWSAAALQFAQAHVMLDPTRLQGGDTAEERKDSQPAPVPSTRDSDRDGQVNER
jgi:hypothetical protein